MHMTIVDAFAVIEKMLTGIVLNYKFTLEHEYKQKLLQFHDNFMFK